MRFHVTWMQLKETILSEVSQKNKHRMKSLIFGIQSNRTREYKELKGRTARSPLTLDYRKEKD